jgi:hypothetical protein
MNKTRLPDTLVLGLYLRGLVHVVYHSRITYSCQDHQNTLLAAGMFQMSTCSCLTSFTCSAPTLPSLLSPYHIHIGLATDYTTLHFEVFSDDFPKIRVFKSLFYADSRNDFNFYPSQQDFTQNRSLCFTVVINLSTNTATFQTWHKIFLVNTYWICSKELS